MGEVNGLSLFFAIFCIVGYVQSDSPLSKLYTDVLQQASDQKIHYIAPGEYDADYNNVTLDLHLVNLLEIDLDEHCGEILIWLIEEFKDPRLTWNPEEYGDFSRVDLPRQNIWVPDWEVFDPRCMAKYFGEYKAVIKSDGSVVRVPVIKLKVNCSPKNEEGEVTCGFKVGSWIYNQNVVNPVLKSEKVDTTDFIVNGNWKLVSATAQRQDTMYSCCPEVYPNIRYTLVFKERNQCH